MSRSIFSCTFILLLMLGSLASKAQLDTTKAARFKFELAPEYLFPTDDHRDIQTVSLNLLIGVEFFRKMPLSIYGGITSTYAWGNIIQWDDNFNDVTSDTKAFGIGPVFHLRYEPFIYRGFSISPDFSGGILFYSKDFPPGGDFYNFMWRFGGSISYRTRNKRYAFNLNAKWMHVSNGQGLGPQNPSYEAWGFGLGAVRYFK